jgi:hypothetical protein
MASRKPLLKPLRFRGLEKWKVLGPSGTSRKGPTATRVLKATARASWTMMAKMVGTLQARVMTGWGVSGQKRFVKWYTPELWRG